jgi:hypothetical protein
MHRGRPAIAVRRTHGRVYLRDVGAQRSAIGQPELRLVQHILEVRRFDSGTLEAVVTPVDDESVEAIELGDRGVCPRIQARVEISGQALRFEGLDDCYSPTRNPELSQHLFALGCTCESGVDNATCVSICTDGPDDAACPPQAIAMWCIEDAWRWGHDGPCGASDDAG